MGLAVDDAGGRGRYGLGRVHVRWVINPVPRHVVSECQSEESPSDESASSACRIDGVVGLGWQARKGLLLYVGVGRKRSGLALPV